MIKKLIGIHTIQLKKTVWKLNKTHQEILNKSQQEILNDFGFDSNVSLQYYNKKNLTVADLADDTVKLNKIYINNKKLQDFEKCIPTMKSNQLRDLCTHVYKCKPTLFNKKILYY